MPGSARYIPPSPPSCISLLAFCDRVHTALVPAWLPPPAPAELQRDEERGEPSMPVHRSLRVACHQARQRTARLSSGHCSARCRPARSPTSILSLPPDRGASRALTCRRLLALPPATPSVPPVCETVVSQLQPLFDHIQQALPDGISLRGGEPAKRPVGQQYGQPAHCGPGQVFRACATLEGQRADFDKPVKCVA